MSADMAAVEDHVISRAEDGVGCITLNRPRALNALSADMCLAISRALLNWKDDGAISSVLIEGAGDRAFCAGGDVRIVAESGKGDGAEARRFFAAEYRMNELLFRYPKSVVAVMDRITMGGGVGLSAPARVRIATERTVWAMPEGDIGLFPDIGGGWHLSRLPGQTGVWLALTGARLGGADCLELGLATHFVPSERLDEARALLVRHGPDLDLVVADPGPAPVCAQRAMIDRLFAYDAVEDIMAALAADGSEWALAQHAILSKKCPTTLKVALRLIREGALRTSFADEMALEFAIAVRMTRRHDFIDGVRAVLVDKDNTPRWSPARLEDVTEGVVEGIFSPLPSEEAWSPFP
jgi:enoyl-CoA hydratase